MQKDRTGSIPYDTTARDKRAQDRELKRNREKLTDEERQTIRNDIDWCRFVARETGTVFLVSPAFTGFQVRTQKGTERIAQNAAEFGRMPFDVAQREAFIYLGQLAKMKDIDPNAKVVEMPDGAKMTGIRASILQKRAREFIASANRNRNL